MERFNIVGGDESQKGKAQQDLNRFKKEGMTPLPYEKEKSQEDLELIALANTLLARQMEEWGLGYVPVEPDRIHLLDAEGWREKYQNDDSHAMHQTHYDRVFVNEHAIQELGLYTNITPEYKRLSAILHEMIHIIGHKKYVLLNDGRAMSYRQGYEAREDFTKEYLFNGLNEAVVDAIVMHILDRNKDGLREELGLEPDFENVKDVHDYLPYICMLGNLIYRISKETGQSMFVLRDVFFKGQFTGEMLHLRTIEKVYGKDALKVIAAWDGTNYKIIDDFLTAETQEERSVLVAQILNK